MAINTPPKLLFYNAYSVSQLSEQLTNNVSQASAIKPTIDIYVINDREDELEENTINIAKPTISSLTLHEYLPIFHQNRFKLHISQKRTCLLNTIFIFAISLNYIHIT